MRHLQSIATTLTDWASTDERIRALVWYGSFARGETTAHSDLDAAVIVRADADITDIVDSCPRRFGSRLRNYTCSVTRGEATFWIDQVLTKVDLLIVSDPEGLAWLADSPDISPPRLIIALDKDNCCHALVERASRPVSRDARQLADEEIDKFIVAFEACSAAHRRSDGYQFYFQFNLALHRLARLVELARGHAVCLFLPKMLLPARMSLPEQLRWRELRGTMYLPEANDAKRRLAAVFLEAVRELYSQAPGARSADELADFLDAVLSRDLFFNVRDFADAYDGTVAEGVLFRSSALTRWKEEPALRAWLSEHRVRCIVDFRHPNEFAEEKAMYPADLLTGIEYVSLPLSGAPRQDATPKPKDAGPVYERQFFAHRQSAIEAIRAILRTRDGSTVVHCHVGKDRTGWFCAALAMLLGLPDEQVVHDYMLSGQGVSSTAIETFMVAVRQAGGASCVFEQAGLSPQEREQLASRLLTRRGSL